MAEPIPARMLLAACDLIRVLKQYCILRNFFIRDVRGFRKELSVFSGGILCAGGIIQDDILNKYHADFVMDYEDGWFQFTGEIEAQVRK